MPVYNLARARGKAKPKLVITTTTGPASYASGGFTVTIDELEKVETAVALASGGYTAEVASISGNTLTIKLYSGAGTEVAAGTDTSGVNITIIALGL